MCEGFASAVDPPFSEGVELLFERLLALPEGRRTLVAIAGAPGSGKSTLADEVVIRLNDDEGRKAAVLPMDGYHFDDGLLRALGLLERKGAPDTFDVSGLWHMLRRPPRYCPSAGAAYATTRSRRTCRVVAYAAPAEGQYR